MLDGSSLEAGTQKVADKCAHEEQTSARDARSRRSALLRSRHFMLALFDRNAKGGRSRVESIYRVSVQRPLDSIPRFHYYPHLIETQRG